MPHHAPRPRQTDRSPILVLLPGTLCDERLFSPLLERLPSYLSLTYTTANARTLTDDAEHFLALCPRPMVLLGFSLGGILALEIALRAPDLVRALILLSTTPRPVPAQDFAARRLAVKQARTSGMRTFVRDQLWPLYTSVPSNAAVLRVVEDMADAFGCEVFAQQTELALKRRDLRPCLHAISCPTLILAGTLDRLCPPPVQHELASIPHSSLTLLSGAGHMLPLERADEVASHVAAWFHLINVHPEEFE